MTHAFAPEQACLLRGVLLDSSLQIDDATFGEDQVETNDFEFDRLDDGTIVCRETGGETRAVIDEDDVREFASDSCRGWCLEYYEVELAEHFKPDEIEANMEKIRSAIEKRLVAKAVRAWNAFSEEQIENGLRRNDGTGHSVDQGCPGGRPD